MNYIDFLIKPNWANRVRAAESLNLSSESLDHLSKDFDSAVRYNVVNNPNTSKETLEYLTRDINIVVKELAVKKLREYDLRAFK